MKWKRDKGSQDAAPVVPAQAGGALGTTPQFEDRYDSFDQLGDEADVTTATQDPRYSTDALPSYNQYQEVGKSAPPPRPAAPPAQKGIGSQSNASQSTPVAQPAQAATSMQQISTFSSVELGTTGTDYAQKAKPLSSSSDHMPIPDYVDADTAAKVKQLRMLTKMLDSTITVPYFKYKIGIDPLIGLVPVVGDCAGLVIGSVVIAIACNYHVPKRTITLMLGNQAIDCAIGVVPLAGDIFDCAWKANAKNLHMIEQHLLEPDVIRKKSNKIWCTVISLITAFVIVNCVIAGLILWGLITLITK